MTDEPHLWEKLRDAQQHLDYRTDKARSVYLTLENAAIHAHEASCFRRHNGTPVNWHAVAIAHVREQLTCSLSGSLKDWFAQHGVTP
jgi:hypothetical protein